MKYKASWDSVPVGAEDKPFAVVQAGTAAKSEAIALRHARAMLEVLRAAKAWKKAYALDGWTDELDAADSRLSKAVARLERIEKEVRGGK